MLSLNSEVVPLRHDPGYKDAIFENRWVLAATRTLLFESLAAACVFATYAIASVMVRMTRGHWLRSAGPFQAEITEAKKATRSANIAIAEVDEISESYVQQIRDQAEALREQLRIATQILGQVSEAYVAAQGENERLRKRRRWL